MYDWKRYCRIMFLQNSIKRKSERKKWRTENGIKHGLPEFCAICSIIIVGLKNEQGYLYGNIVDLCLQVSGFTFEELNKSVNIFKAGKVSIKVAYLNKLLKMKEIAARNKDELFLGKYKLILDEEIKNHP